MLLQSWHDLPCLVAELTKFIRFFSSFVTIQNLQVGLLFSCLDVLPGAFVRCQEFLK